MPLLDQNKIFKSDFGHEQSMTFSIVRSLSLSLSFSDGLVVVGVHSAKFPNEKVSVFIACCFIITPILYQQIGVILDGTTQLKS